jgi:hypothetical protein
VSRHSAPVRPQGPDDEEHAVINEQQRSRLHRRLEERLGDEEAGTMMELLPPVGWADVATKHDLAHLERRFDRMEGRFDRLEARFEAVAHDQVRWVLASQAVTLGWVTALVALV